MKNTLKGIFPSFLTPLNSDESLDETGVIRETNYLLDAQVHGLWLAGTGGEVGRGRVAGGDGGGGGKRLTAKVRRVRGGYQAGPVTMAPTPGSRRMTRWSFALSEAVEPGERGSVTVTFTGPGGASKSHTETTEVVSYGAPRRVGGGVRPPRGGTPAPR